MVTVRIPATSANMGPGFDSMGIALKLYNYVSAEETDGGLEIEITDSTREFLPTDETNLVYRCMKRVFDEVGYRPRGIKLTLTNNIPVTRGLGSSSACIVGGLTAGNALSGGRLSRDDILNIAAKLEGHADNVTPAVFGGFTVSVLQREELYHIHLPVGDGLRFAAFIPDFQLATKKSREALPDTVSHKDAVYNAGHSALLTASLISGHYENIRPAIGDRLHQGYRRGLIPSMDEIFELSYRYDALGVYLSGAGPALIAIIREENRDFFPEISRVLTKKLKSWHLEILEADIQGAVEIK